MRLRARPAAFAVSALTLFGVLPALLMAWPCWPAERLPQPPCAGPAAPAYTAPGSAAAVTVWTDEAALADWQPPACTGWDARPTSILVAVASQFHYEGDGAALLGRFAAISKLPSIRYWSATRKRWRQLYEGASALEGPDPDARRADFSVADLRPGESLFFLQDENGPVDVVVQRMSVRELDRDRFVIEMENHSPAFLTFMPFVPTLDARATQVLFFIERDADKTWNYYSLMRLSGATSLFDSLEKSSVNRMIALFRHYAGRQTDLEPPAAP